ncbi:hypothetical protein GMORB2_0948 [Geosmithia morbida]|uniref:Uncharacterized protein n=1 Tax=Geosmithia morbida TaxID=1094350 RepID=A0A9P5D8N6_9HYPO|nr:uncharacterized protein GMORB2_0948 [Geosmithia morbida]KAF4125704.1 hypothetical protein GMORB2_0948 [Geosmithia morbida]
MPPRRKQIEVSTTADIIVSYVGKKSILWEPAETDSRQSAEKPTTDPTNQEEQKRAYGAFVRSEIERLSSPAAGKPASNKLCGRIQQRRDLVALLAVVFDPTSDVNRVLGIPRDGFSREEELKLSVHTSCSRLGSIISAWDMSAGGAARDGTREENKGEGSDLEDDEQEEQQDAPKTLTSKSSKNKLTRGKSRRKMTGKSTEANRSPADLSAQRHVPTWYGSRCVLSGLIKPEGAHIVPARTVRDTDMDVIWVLLKTFWPLPQLEGLGMVWLRNLDIEGGLEAGSWDHRALGSIADFRRGSISESQYPVVHHGDVYLLTTIDCETHPLPSLRLLPIQYAAHKITAGIRAAGALRVIFSDIPPDDPGPAGYDVDVPDEWQSLIEASVDAGVLGRHGRMALGPCFHPP